VTLTSTMPSFPAIAPSRVSAYLTPGVGIKIEGEGANSTVDFSDEHETTLFEIDGAIDGIRATVDTNMNHLIRGGRIGHLSGAIDHTPGRPLQAGFTAAEPGKFCPVCGWSGFFYQTECGAFGHAM
jgi:hypothetical protein